MLGEARVSTYAITIRTTDRQPKAKNYVFATLANLQRAGVFGSQTPFQLRIFADATAGPAFIEQLRAWETRCNRLSVDTADRKPTPNGNAARALQWAAAQDSDYVIFLEDDLDFCACFLESVDAWLGTHRRPDRHLYPLCAAYPRAIRDVLRRGGESWEYPIASFYGTQGYVLPREEARRCAAYMAEHPTYRGVHQGHDLLLTDWARETWPEVKHFLATAPCFVQHVGEESSLHPGRFHAYAAFAGQNWSYGAVRS